MSTTFEYHSRLPEEEEVRQKCVADLESLLVKKFKQGKEDKVEWLRKEPYDAYEGWSVPFTRQFTSCWKRLSANKALLPPSWSVPVFLIIFSDR